MRVVVAATAAFGAAVLEGLADKHEVEVVLTRPDRAQGRGRRVGASPAKARAAIEIATKLVPILLTVTGSASGMEPATLSRTLRVKRP